MPKNLRIRNTAAISFLIRVTGSYIETETVDLRSVVTGMMLFPVSMDKFLTCYKDSDQILESGTGTGLRDYGSNSCSDS
jgi:hypothetical protein